MNINKQRLKKGKLYVTKQILSGLREAAVKMQLR